MTDANFILWLQSSDAIRLALVEVTARIAGAETVLYLASRPFVTGATESPANTGYEPCIVGSLSVSEQLSLDGQASISYGDIEIDNRAGRRDAWLGYVWVNRTAKIYMGDPRWPRSDFRLVFDGVVGDIDSRSAEVLNLRLLNKLERLNTPVADAVLGGVTANKSRLLPTAFGECFNITPLLTNPTTLEYQVHGAAIEDIIEVRDNGMPVTVTKFVATGKFTLSQAPVGTITASVQGDKPAAYGNTIASTVQRLATGYGVAAMRFTASDLDSASLAAFASANPQPIGLYASDRTNVLVACQQLAASVGAQVVMTSAGLLRLVQLALPAAGVPTALSADDMDYHTLSVSQRPDVRASCVLGFCTNWTMQDTGLAGGVPAANAALLGAPALAVVSTDSAVAGVYRLDAAPVQINTLLLVESDAQAEALRRRDLWKTPRMVYSARCRAGLLLTELGDAVTLTHARFGLSAGKTGQVVSIARDWLAGRITLGVLA